MSKLSLVVAAGLGFLAGSRAGHGPYEQVTAYLFKLRQDPRVQKAAAQTRDTVQEKASEAASIAADVVKDKTSSAMAAVKNVASSEEPERASTTPTSTSSENAGDDGDGARDPAHEVR